MSSKSVTVLLEKIEKLKNVLKRRYGPSEKKWKTLKCPQKRYGPSEKSKKVKNVLKQHYDRIGTKNRVDRG